jgi:hypothetical protein
MIKFRTFKTKIGHILSNRIVSDYDGLEAMSLRLRMYFATLEKNIQEQNKKILEELENEEPEVKSSMLNDEFIDNSLNHFNDLLLQSFIISLLSYFETQLKKIAKTCDEELSLKQRFKKYTHRIAFNYKEYIKNNLIAELQEQESVFIEVEKWINLRNYIVHKDNERRPDPNFLSENEIKLIEDNVHFKNNQVVKNLIDLVFSYLYSIVELSDEQTEFK